MMSHSSKRMIAGIAAEILLIIAYLVYVFSGRAPAPDDIKSWAAAILIFIGAGVAVMIVIQILFRIALAIGKIPALPVCFYQEENYPLR